MMHPESSPKQNGFSPHDFIVESNCIDRQYTREGEIYPAAAPGDLLYDNTRHAFGKFKEWEAIRPTPLDLTHRIHKELLAGVAEIEELGFLGRYRESGATIARFIKCPEPRIAQRFVEEVLIPSIEEKRGQALSSDEVTQFAWWCHDLFECAHPYVDGNGRTGRVLLNFVRSLFDSPGQVIWYDQRELYYANIRKFRLEEFSLILEGLGCGESEIRELCSEEAVKERKRKADLDFYIRVMELEQKAEEDKSTKGD